MGKALRDFFVKYFDFEGRSTRSDYWFMKLWGLIFYFPFTIIIGLIATVVLPYVSEMSYEGGTSDDAFLGPFLVFTLPVIIAILIPCLSLLCRRLHDAGHSSFLAIIYYIAFPVIYVIVGICCEETVATAMIITLSMIAFIVCIFIFIWTLEGSAPDNKWGPNPYGLKKKTNNAQKYVICKNCGCQELITNRFCSHCGNKMQNYIKEEN